MSKWNQTKTKGKRKKKKKRLDFIFYPDSVFILQELIVGFAGDRSLLCLSPRSLWGPPRSWGALRGEGPLSAALWCPNSPGLEKAMAPLSSTLAWKIPWMEEPGRLQSMGSLGVRHDWATWLSLFTFMHWRRKWQPTPVFLPGESQGRGSLVGCRLWGRAESDMTEAT